MKLYVSKGAKVSVAPFAGAWIEIVLENEKFSTESVAPFAGAWIEIYRYYAAGDASFVAPFAGAWIEIPPPPTQSTVHRSLPSREHGLK